MALTKKQRQEVWDKSSGICWYCGIALTDKGWHADHIEPIRRNKDSCDNPHLDTIDNIVPSCRPCNLFKSVLSIEGFRHEISHQTARARHYNVNFRTAERFGLIEVVDKPVMFWFEIQQERDSNGST